MYVDVHVCVCVCVCMCVREREREEREKGGGGGAQTSIGPHVLFNGKETTVDLPALPWHTHSNIRPTHSQCPTKPHKEEKQPVQ